MLIQTYMVTFAGYKAQNAYDTLTPPHYPINNHLRHELEAVKWKKRLILITIVSGLLMTYFYYRHNAYCEPYVYSMFCLTEYAVVVFNMIFHLSDIYHNYYK